MVNHLGNWKNGELGDFVTLKRGFDLPQQKREDGQVPIFSSSGITGTHSTAMVKAPGVITGRYGTIGEVFYAAEDFWPLNTDRKSTRLNSSHREKSRMPSSA